MSTASEDNWRKWVSKAEEAENHALKLDRDGHSNPTNIGLFLEAAKYSRRGAEYQRLASESTDNQIQKTVALSNYCIMTANCYKSLGNFFYYSSRPARAAKFFERAAIQHAVSKSHIPPELNNYATLIQESSAHELELRTLVYNCNGMVAKIDNNWVEALEYFRFEKKKWEELKSLGGNYVQSLNINAVIKSAEREIQICQVMIYFYRSDFPKSLKYAEWALSAAIEMLQAQPTWIFYQKALISAISLREKLVCITKILKTAHAHAITEKNQSFLNNLISYKFMREVESHLRREYQYPNTSCSYKPPYLGREIDVYASKGGQKMTITICECRLRLDGQPISADEIEKFSELSRTVRQYEQSKAAKEGKTVTIYAWFITNIDSAEKDALDIARKNNIEIKQAVIPKERKRLFSDANWSVSGIRSL